MCRCEKCEYLKNVFGNFVECVLLHHFVDYEYWNNETPADCPFIRKCSEKNEAFAGNKKQ